MSSDDPNKQLSEELDPGPLDDSPQVDLDYDSFDETESDCESESFQHQESEIREEAFYPGIEEVEQDRLEAIVRTRSLLRDAELVSEQSQKESDQLAFISREETQTLYKQLLTLSESPDPENTESPQSALPEATEMQQPAGSTAVISSEPPHIQGTDYINQAIVDMVLQDTQTPTQASANNLSVDNGGQNNFKRVPSSNGYQSQGDPSIRKSKYCQRQQPVAVLDATNLGEFEKRLLQAKRKSVAMMPNIYKIPWYHPGISRHIAECLLLSKDIRDGTYLLRDCVSEANTVTLSVRCQDSVKHYRVSWDGKKFLFGLGKFNTLEEFKDHFSHQPIISGESGVLVQLRYPYPRGVSEPAIYLEANVISDADNVGVDLQEKQKAVAKSNKPSKLLNSLDFSINSKEGYLTKMGFHRKNWKKRWFVLYRNELKYFNCSGDKDPLRVINLDDVTSIDRDNSVGKSNCFRLVTPYRTFYMYATSEVEANEWVQILDWKLKKFKR